MLRIQRRQLSQPYRMRRHVSRLLFLEENRRSWRQDWRAGMGPVDIVQRMGRRMTATR